MFLVIVNIALEDTQAFQRHLGLISSLKDPLLVSARAAGIPRASSLSVPESAPVKEPPELTPVYEEVFMNYLPVRPQPRRPFMNSLIVLLWPLLISLFQFYPMSLSGHLPY